MRVTAGAAVECTQLGARSLRCSVIRKDLEQTFLCLRTYLWRIIRVVEPNDRPRPKAMEGTAFSSTFLLVPTALLHHAAAPAPAHGRYNEAGRRRAAGSWMFFKL